MDVLEMGVLDYNALTQGEQSALKIDSSVTGGLDSIEKLQRRLLEYVTVRSLENMPVTLADVSRRFSRPAKALGITTTDIVSAFCRTGKLVTIERRGQTGLFNLSLYNMLIKMREELGVEGDLPTMLINNMLNMTGV